mmetsp:Transcript_12760/g.28192  ORF Transcript_12760/g.28192 Transcript_12760/m.28192 type:complete len:216 (+) Transcript_12760:162-809(+)
MGAGSGSDNAIESAGNTGRSSHGKADWLRSGCGSATRCCTRPSRGASVRALGDRARQQHVQRGLGSADRSARGRGFRWCSCEGRSPRSGPLLAAAIRSHRPPRRAGVADYGAGLLGSHPGRHHGADGGCPGGLCVVATIAAGPRGWGGLAHGWAVGPAADAADGAEEHGGRDAVPELRACSPLSIVAAQTLLQVAVIESSIRLGCIAHRLSCREA